MELIQKFEKANQLGTTGLKRFLDLQGIFTTGVKKYDDLLKIYKKSLASIRKQFKQTKKINIEKTNEDLLPILEKVSPQVKKQKVIKDFEESVSIVLSNPNEVYIEEANKILNKIKKTKLTKKESKYVEKLVEVVNTVVEEKKKSYLVKVLIDWYGRKNTRMTRNREYKNDPYQYVLDLTESESESSEYVSYSIEEKFREDYSHKYFDIIRIDEIRVLEVIPDISADVLSQDINDLPTNPMFGFKMCYTSFISVSETENECVPDTIKWYANDPENRLKRLVKKNLPIFTNKGVTDNEWKAFREENNIPGIHYIVNNGGFNVHHEIKAQNKGRGKSHGRKILNTANINGHMYITYEEPKDKNYTINKGYAKKFFTKSHPLHTKNEILNPSYEQITQSNNENFIFTDPQKINAIYKKFLDDGIICSSKKNSFGPELNTNYDISFFIYKKNTIKLINTETERSIKILEDMGIQKYYSSRSISVKNYFNSGKLHAIMYSKGTIDTSNLITIDDSKHYTRSLYELEHIYICNSLCDFVILDASSMIDRNNLSKGFYIVESDDYYNFPIGNGIYPDYNLKEANKNNAKYQIMGFLKPWKIVPNPFKKIIEDIYNKAFIKEMWKVQPKEDEIDEKKLINTITGLLERTTRYKKYKAIFNNALDCYNYRHNGRFKEIKKEGNLHTTIKVEEHEIEENGFLIKQQIYGMSYILFNRMLSSVGISDMKTMEQRVKRRYVDSATILDTSRMMSNILSTPTVQIGIYEMPQYKFEQTKATKPTNARKQRKQVIPEIKEIIDINLKNAFSDYSKLSEILKGTENLLINGRAKSGKTQGIVKFIRENSNIKNYKVIVPKNTMRLNFDSAFTIQTFMCENRNKWEYTPLLIIDEIYNINTLEAQRIIEYHQRFPNTRIIAAGSDLQNDGLDFYDQFKYAENITVESIQCMDFPVLQNIFDIRITYTSGVDEEAVEMQNKATELKKDKKKITNYEDDIDDILDVTKIKSLDELPNMYYITRSNELKKQINEALYKQNKDFEPIRVRPIKNIGKFVKYEPCEIINDNDNIVTIRSLHSTNYKTAVVNRELIELDYCSTICLSQSLRLGEYGVVLYKKQFERLSDKEIEVAFTRDPNCHVFLYTS